MSATLSMKIYIFNNGDETFHVAINEKNCCEDSTCKTWNEVLAILASLKPIK
jgi:hypothetical protein